MGCKGWCRAAARALRARAWASLPACGRRGAKLCPLPRRAQVSSVSLASHQLNVHYAPLSPPLNCRPSVLFALWVCPRRWPMLKTWQTGWASRGRWGGRQATPVVAGGLWTVCQQGRHCNRCSLRKKSSHCGRCNLCNSLSPICSGAGFVQLQAQRAPRPPGVSHPGGKGVTCITLPPFVCPFPAAWMPCADATHFPRAFKPRALLASAAHCTHFNPSTTPHPPPLYTPRATPASSTAPAWPP